MRSTPQKFAAMLLCALLLLTGCGAQASEADPAAGEDTTAETVTVISAIDAASLFSDRDLAGTYDESEAVTIQLSGDSAACDSAAVTVDGGQITIGAEGVYLLSGTLTDGQIVVDAGDTDKVQLVLSGADITSSTSAAIYALEADKVFLTLADGTENTLSNGGTYTAIDDSNIDAVVFAKTDLTLNGSGSLTINAQAGHGVVSKDELTITGGSYTITAASHGLSGKDGIAIAGGTFSITSGKDGIHSENADDLSLGALYIADGSFIISAEGDAVSAQGALQIDGGSFDLTAGEGSQSVEMTSGSDFGQVGGHRGGEAAAAESAAETEENSVSQKGIKGESSCAINGGTFTIDSADDCLHAGGTMTIAAGTFTLSSGDDAVHCDDALTIQSGTFTIPYCYEGMEGLSITIEDGICDITSHDDGLNAAGGADSSGFEGFGGRQDSLGSSSDSFITINGGALTIVSGGDSIDSNGDLTINGGTLDLTCNGSGDTALDCDGTYAHNGGDVTTNDGSEASLGQMGARGGAPGGKGGGQPDTAPDGAQPGDRRPQAGEAAGTPS